MIEEFRGGGSSIFSNRVNADESYLYHYTSADTLAKILESQSLLLGPYSGTNDPRKTSHWSPTIELDGDDAAASPEEIRQLWQLTRDVREGVKLACFTLDAEIDQPELRLPFHRGWARARMWHQYADRHSGACLIFDRGAWEQSLQSVRGANSFVLYDGAVRYEDTRLGHFINRLEFSSAELRAGQVEKTVARIVQTHGQDLFFRKNRDWESEKEYRYLAVSGTPREFVPVSTSLVGIVLGQDFPETELSVLGDRLRRNGLERVKCARLVWQDGAPSICVDQDSRGANLLVLPPLNVLDGDPSA